MAFVALADKTIWVGGLIASALFFAVGFIILRKITDAAEGFINKVGIAKEQATAFLDFFYYLMLFLVIGRTLEYFPAILTPDVLQIRVIGSAISTIASNGFIFFLPVAVLYIVYIWTGKNQVTQ